MNTFMRIANKNKSMTSTAIYITKKGKNIQNEKSKSQLTHTHKKKNCKHKYTQLCIVCMYVDCIKTEKIRNLYRREYAK